MSMKVVQQFCIVAVIFSLQAIVSAADETIQLTPFYPSPKGIYNSVRTTELTTVQDSLLLSQDAELKYHNGSSSLNNDRFLTNRLSFNGEKYYTPILKTQILDASDILPATGDWKVPRPSINLPSIPALALGAFTGTVVCGQSEVINSVISISTAVGFCVPIPIGGMGGTMPVICLGREDLKLFGSCMNTDLSETGITAF